MIGEINMTTEELRRHFNDNFELDKWPETFEVDHETYANVCNYIFSLVKENGYLISIGSITRIGISVGLNGGILFKNVELILKGNNNGN